MFQRRMPWRWLLVAVWIGCIWFMSAHSAPPGNPIGRLTSLVQGTPLQPPLLPGKSLAFSLGKLGHLWEYCVLGGLLSWALVPSGRPRWLSVPIGITTAGIDETIQRFVPGREGCLRDVLIDTTGLITGLLIFTLLSLAIKIHLHSTKKRSSD